jgi:hypothetical protein
MILQLKGIKVLLSGIEKCGNELSLETLSSKLPLMRRACLTALLLLTPYVSLRAEPAFTPASVAACFVPHQDCAGEIVNAIRECEADDPGASLRVHLSAHFRRSDGR